RAVPVQSRGRARGEFPGGWRRRTFGGGIREQEKGGRSRQTAVGRRRPWRRGEGRPSPSPPMEKVQKNPPRQLRSRRVWSRKWLIRYSRKRSFFPPTSASLKTVLVPDRYNRLDGRASHHGIDFEPSADLLQALAHTRQPDALRGGVVSTDQLTRAADARHTFAGILDRQHDSVPVRCALAHETDLRRSALGMSGNVGHGFLHDAEQYQF